ncbi:MAG: polysaccharide export protein [Deltaproteobacteria bacterium]|jgi:polysaccharide export outer membrane protein|nr:polysaccharide export protein [Deltaproteobacteria bacterium]
MIRNSVLHRFCLLAGLCLLVAALSGCALPSSGPSYSQVQHAVSSTNLEGITLVNVDDALTRKLMAGYKNDRFSDIFGASRPTEYLIGPGDVIEVSVWEAPPAMLFGSIAVDVVTAGIKTTRAETLPAQMVMEDGNISVPFAGRIFVAGKSIRAIEADITKRLQGQANNPQIIVRVARGNTTNVTVIGDTTQSAQFPLTPKGERLLDAIAQAGGVKQPVSRMSVQLSRKSVIATMPLDAVIRDPKQNIALMPGDVVTALFQPKSFTVFGAAGRTQEVPFEAQGISLAQALARSGGLDDMRADARGLFLFRFEDARLVETDKALTPAADGTTPVVYQVNMNDPTSLFVTQNFPVKDRDVIYVAHASAVEFEKFLRMLGLAMAPATSTIQSIYYLQYMQYLNKR